MQFVKVGLCGLGTVGSGTVALLKRNQRVINARAGCQIILHAIASRRENPTCDMANIHFSTDIFSLVDNPDIQIIVELIGGTSIARDLVLRAIERGKHVVTANKALIAEHGNEIFTAAKKRRVVVAFEASVAGSIPIIRSIREGLSANQIDWIAGIINGTGNFILTEMRDRGRDFDEVLRDAQTLGYAEADPSFDVDGIDAAHKLVIMASLAFGMPLCFHKVYREGISKIEPQDVCYAEELGYRVKQLGIARRVSSGIELRVHPALIPEKRLLAQVDGVMNAVLVKSDAAGPTLYYGAGAGAEPTASSVVADIIDVARTLTAAPEHRVPHHGFHMDSLTDLPIVAMENVETAYYVRLLVQDRPGVLAKITQLLSTAGVSIKAIIQKQPQTGEDTAKIILLTNLVREKYLMSAISAIEALDLVDGPVIHFRVETLS